MGDVCNVEFGIDSSIWVDSESPNLKDQIYQGIIQRFACDDNHIKKEFEAALHYSIESYVLRKDNMIFISHSREEYLENGYLDEFLELLIEAMERSEKEIIPFLNSFEIQTKKNNKNRSRYM